MTRPARSVLFAALVAVASTPLFGAEADKPRELLQPPKKKIASPITDRFSLRGVYYQPSVDMPMRYDASETDLGTPITGEDTLGFDDELNQGMLEMMFRMGDRHRIRADFYKLSRSGDVVLAEDFQFGDYTYQASDRTISSLDLRMLGIGYTFSVLRRERVELGLGVGVHLLDAQGEVAVPLRQLREEFEVTGPFGAVSVDGTWRFTQRFSVNARAQYLSGDMVEVDEADGSFLLVHGDVQFRWRPNLAFGLGYTHQAVRVDGVDDDFSGRFVLKSSGPEAFVSVSF